MSVKDIIAACRAADGGGASSSKDKPQTPDAPTPDAPAPAEGSQQPATSQAASEPGPAESGPEAKKSGNMSVQEILAAARAEKAKPPAGDSASPPAAEASESASSAPAKPPGKMSVAEIMAAARSEKAGKAAAAKHASSKPGASQPAGKAATATQAAPKPAAGKAAAGKAAAGPLDTASILAAARSGEKPGPITKAEAAARSEPARPQDKTKPAVPARPERPAYVRQAAARPAPESDRRGFFAAIMGAFVGSSLAIGFSTLAITNLLWLLGLARFMFPNILTEPPTSFKVGFPDELAPGQVETKYKAQFGAWIVRDEFDGVPQIFALQSVCTHLGCTPNWLEGEQKFKCPCHGSGFYKDGINFEGPAPRPLERFAIRLADDGQLEVDKSRRFNEEMGQWSDPASFVPV